MSADSHDSVDAASSPNTTPAAGCASATSRDRVEGVGSICIVRQHHRYEIATRREAEAYRDPDSAGV